MGGRKTSFGISTRAPKRNGHARSLLDSAVGKACTRTRAAMRACARVCARPRRCAHAHPRPRPCPCARARTHTHTHTLPLPSLSLFVHVSTPAPVFLPSPAPPHRAPDLVRLLLDVPHVQLRGVRVCHQHLGVLRQLADLVHLQGSWGGGGRERWGRVVGGGRFARYGTGTGPLRFS